MCSSISQQADSADLSEVMKTIYPAISGNRARDYTMRIWQYDKWSTLPMWQKSTEEIRDIMLERGFDKAEIVEKPADGITKVGTWTTPIGWDVKQATLEVIEPSNLPDHIKYLCDYLDNPTSLGCWSGSTPPEGIEAEIVLIEESTEKALKAANPRDKIVLVSSNSRGMKKYLDANGVPGIITDQIEDHSVDSVTANNWLNGWTDLPGGWLMTAYDSQKPIRFSISQKKGAYLRNLLRRGVKVKVRAKVDSRYYTDDMLTYNDGYVRGSGSEGEDVLIGGHSHEWGASDNAAGCGSALEAVGALNDLITSGSLPRPRRGLRLWFGSEIHGSLAFGVDNLEHLRNKTVASIMLDDGGGDYDEISSLLDLVMNPNCLPTFADAILEEVAQQYFAKYQPQRRINPRSYLNADNIFCDPMTGVPSNWIKMNNTNPLHHNSKDTIDKIDPRSLRDTSIIGALYLYVIADAGYDELDTFARLTGNRGRRLIHDKYSEFESRLEESHDGASLGKLMADAEKTLSYYTGLQQDAVFSIERLIEDSKKKEAHSELQQYADAIQDYGDFLVGQFKDAVKNKAKSNAVKIAKAPSSRKISNPLAETIVPKRNYYGVISLQGIPVDKWVEVRSDPHWWGATNWASSSIWWCDGVRNLNEIKELCELEAGREMRNFDLVKYYTFLEEYGLVEFVGK